MNEIEFANVLRLVLAFVVLSAFARVGFDVVRGFIDGYRDGKNKNRNKLEDENEVLDRDWETQSHS